MKRRLKKALAAGSLATMLLSPLSVLAAGSSYSITYDFETARTGATRSFSGTSNDLKVYWTSYTSERCDDCSNNFTAKLYEPAFGPDTYYGSRSVPRIGSQTNSWTDVGSGDYYLKLSKTSDGVRVISNSGAKIYMPDK